MANNPESEPITVGLHDDLLTHISKISALKVISRTSVLRYKGTQKSIKEIAKELSVANILEGGVQKSGNQIRINVQLINARTDEHIWAEIYDRELTVNNIFKIQSEISAEIAAALKAELSPQDQQSLAQKPTDNLDAYNAYNAGRQRIVSRNSSDLKQALSLFQRATELDPNFALAYVGQADTLRLLNGYSDLASAEMFQRGEPLLAKALSLAPELAEAHTSKAGYLGSRGLYAEAETSFKYSLSLNPNYATTYLWYGIALHALGRLPEALSMFRKAAELDPMSAIILSNIPWSLLAAGEKQQALVQFHRVLELYPNFSQAFVGIATVNSEMGKFVEAIIWNRKSIVADGGSFRLVGGMVISYLNIGDIEAAKQELANAKKRIPQHEKFVYLEFIFDLLSADKQRALIRVEQALQKQPGDPGIKGFYAFVNMLNGQYKTAIDSWVALYPGKNEKIIELTASNVYVAAGLAWSLKQSGQTEQAEQLITDALELIKETPSQEVSWSKVELLAVKDDPQAAAVAYALAVKNNAISEWWQLDLLPYVEAVKKQPEYIAAHQQLMDNLKSQREALAQHDVLEKPQ